MLFVTDFADQAVILPILVTVAAVLAAFRLWRTALLWVVSVAGVLGAVLALKVLCYACSWLVPPFGPDRLDVQSPSGHVASASVIYTGLALLLGCGSSAGRGHRVVLALGISLSIAVLIGITRLRLGAHSMAEVVIAAAVGTGGALLLASTFVPLQTSAPGSVRPRAAIAAAVGMLLLLLHGLHLPAEAVIQNRLGEQLRQWVTACQPPAAVAEAASARPGRR